MDCCAVFVDAGLYAEGRKLIGLGPSRRNVRLDASGANQFPDDLAVTGCQLPVRRTYWNDGAPRAHHQLNQQRQGQSEDS